MPSQGHEFKMFASKVLMRWDISRIKVIPLPPTPTLKLSPRSLLHRSARLRTLDQNRYLFHESNSGSPLIATMLRPSLRCSGSGLLGTRFTKRSPCPIALRKSSVLGSRSGFTLVSSIHLQQRGYAVAAAETDKGVVGNVPQNFHTWLNCILGSQ
jgi:hypothetical protein